MSITDEIRQVEKNGTMAKGKAEYLTFLKGGNLTIRERVLANCYQCTGMYSDGKKDCEMEQCTLHSYMPYRKGGVVKLRVLSEEAKARLKAQLKRRGKTDDIAVACSKDRAGGL